MMTSHDKNKPYDLSEEASRRPGDEPATNLARQIESDDINEETASGQTDEPEEGGVENKIATSLDDE